MPTSELLQSIVTSKGDRSCETRFSQCLLRYGMFSPKSWLFSFSLKHYIPTAISPTIFLPSLPSSTHFSFPFRKGQDSQGYQPNTVYQVFLMKAMLRSGTLGKMIGSEGLCLYQWIHPLKDSESELTIESRENCEGWGLVVGSITWECVLEN